MLSSSFRGGSINSPVDICSTATLLRIFACARPGGANHRACGTGFTSRRGGTHRRRPRRHTDRCRRPRPCQSRRGGGGACAPPGRLVALVHGPLAHEAGLSPAAAQRAAEREGALLLRLLPRPLCQPENRRRDASDGFSPDRIGIAPPGTAKPNQHAWSRRGPVRALLCVANLVPLKGHSVLVAALAQLRDLDCSIAVHRVPRGRSGNDGRGSSGDRRRGSRCRIVLAGERAPAAVAAAYSAADARLAPFDEGYGMVCAEAMANTTCR